MNSRRDIKNLRFKIINATSRKRIMDITFSIPQTMNQPHFVIPINY